MTSSVQDSPSRNTRTCCADALETRNAVATSTPAICENFLNMMLSADPQDLAGPVKLGRVLLFKEPRLEYLLQLRDEVHRPCGLGLKTILNQSLAAAPEPCALATGCTDFGRSGQMLQGSANAAVRLHRAQQENASVRTPWFWSFTKRVQHRVADADVILHIRLPAPRSPSAAPRDWCRCATSRSEPRAHVLSSGFCVSRSNRIHADAGIVIVAGREQQELLDALVVEDPWVLLRLDRVVFESDLIGSGLLNHGADAGDGSFGGRRSGSCTGPAAAPGPLSLVTITNSATETQS